MTVPAFDIRPGANQIRTVERRSNMAFEKNVDIPLADGGLCRCNVYRPLEPGRYPVIMTMGPYGKDIPYAQFHVKSFAEIPDEQKGDLSAWETPHPDVSLCLPNPLLDLQSADIHPTRAQYWVSQGYVVVRVDERGVGSSPGFLDTMSASTSSDFAECVEWAAEQEWSTGKIGLLGISYYGGTQWRVAARKPKGLTCIIPWEGTRAAFLFAPEMKTHAKRCRHDGLLPRPGSPRRYLLEPVCPVLVQQPGRPDAIRQCGKDGPPLGSESAGRRACR